MLALILAGGLGTRLRSVVADRPKALALIQDKPFLTLLLEYLQTQGFTRVILALGYKYEQIISLYYPHSFTFDLQFSIEDIPLGTGGAILYAIGSLKINQPMCIINGDTFLPLDYRALYALHQQQHSNFTMTLSYQQDTGRYGCVTLKDNHVVDFYAGKLQQAGYINAGVYLLHPSIFYDFLLPVQFSFENDFLQKYIQQLQPLAYCTNANFIDIGIPEDYQRAQSL